ncbi:MAG: hypothetical protein SGJ27_22515 [Candidatus Melainabacteria bacterium]|nr:hypothetical protein [Candidatus Melainabacteria bacterium]
MNISRLVINLVLTLMLALTVNIVSIWAPMAVLRSPNVLFLSIPLTVLATICGAKLGKHIGRRKEPLKNAAFCYAGIAVLAASMVSSIAAFLYVLPISAVPVAVVFGSVLSFANALSTLFFMWLIRTPE